LDAGMKNSRVKEVSLHVIFNPVMEAIPCFFFADVACCIFTSRSGSKMKKNIFYIVIFVLYLFVPVCAAGVLGAMINLKYEVDERYWEVDAKDDLMAHDKAQAFALLEGRRDELEDQIYFLIIAGIAAGTTATFLFIRRSKWSF
jgi:hypothetical protein